MVRARVLTVALGLLAASVLATPSAAQFQPLATTDPFACPVSVEAPPAYEEPPLGWSIGISPWKTVLAAVAIYDGPPEEQVQAKFTTKGNVQTWDLKAPKKGAFWVLCEYASTVITLARQLPDNVVRCEATRDAKATLRDGKPAIGSMRCALGPPRGAVERQDMTAAPKDAAKGVTKEVLKDAPAEAGKEAAKGDAKKRRPQPAN